MPKLNICAARRPGMTRAQYARYSTDDHARLVLGTEPVARYLQTYLQLHVHDACYGSEAPTWRYDSVAHIVTATIADQMAATSAPQYKEHIQPDESRFVDQRSALFLMFDEDALPLPARGASRLRLLHYLRAKPGVAPAELHKRWAEAHAALLDDTGRLFNGVRRATLNKAMAPPGIDAPPYAGMCELGFLQASDETAMGEYVTRMEDKLDALIQRDASFFLLAEAVLLRGTLS